MTKMVIRGTRICKMRQESVLQVTEVVHERYRVWHIAVEVILRAISALLSKAHLHIDSHLGGDQYFGIVICKNTYR